MSNARATLAPRRRVDYLYAMARADGKLPTSPATSAEVADFLRVVAGTPVRSGGEARGRLVFAMDATASRQPAWERAAHIQAEMFQATAALGGLDLQLAFYRGFGEFKVSPWIADSDRLARLMGSVSCRAGQTRIVKVLRHVRNETSTRRVNALVFVGDCVEEDVDALGHAAGELGVLGVPAFMFHEGDDPVAAFAFRQVARLSGGAYARFDAGSAGVLRELLGAVAVFAAGGRAALEDHARAQGGAVPLLAGQMRPGRGA